jgi:serine/threonine-protein kinase
MSARGVKPGDVLGGKYRVERVLGVGGMGIVVAAMHIDLGQRVALKFMLKEAMTEHAERFLREAKSAVQLRSVHTARVLDVGRLKNDEPYMVMEYLEGRDLDAELHMRGPLPPHVAVDFILQASEALAEAHGLGMIHRDVKLKNMFLTMTVDGRPLVKVLDFGLAKTIGANSDVSLTATNSVFGSPQYMSPEQMRSAKDVDFRSDIWSIGVCLYELLTGRLPYDAQGVAEICAMVLKDPVPPPSNFARGLPKDLEEAVLKCLEKDVEKRYQSIAEVAFALQQYAADEGSALRILNVMQTAQKTEHPTIVTSGPPLDAGPKTIQAWDSGLPTQRTTPPILTRLQMAAAIACLVILALAGIAATVVALKSRSRPVVAASSAPPPASAVPAMPTESSPPAASAAAPPAESPGGTAIGAGNAPESPPEAPPHAATAIPGPPRTVRTNSSAAPPTKNPNGKPGTKPKNGPGSGADYM